MVLLIVLVHQYLDLRELAVGVPGHAVRDVARERVQHLRLLAQPLQLL